MPILRATIVSLLLASPLWAEAHAPVIGAKRMPHHAAPLPADGEGDYGFSGGVKAHRAAPEAAPGMIPPDKDLLAYEQEEALIEAEAALASGAADEPTVIID